MALGTYFIAFTLAILPALFWLIIYYKKDYRDPEPKKVIAKTFGIGMMAAIPFFLLRLWLPYHPIFSGIILFAILEEMAKLVATIWIVNRHKIHFNQLIDGAMYAIAAALGFAFVENMVYFISYFQGSYEGAIYLVAFRSLGTMLAHTIFSGLAGLLWAYAYFSKDITNKNTKGVLAFEFKDFVNREIMTLHIVRRNILIAHPSRRGGHEEKILVLEGIFLATVLHALYNLLTEFEIFGKSLTFLLVPTLMIGLLLILYLFAKKFNQRMFKVV